MAFTVSRSRIAPVIAKVETTAGTDAEPSGATDALYTIDSAVTVDPDFSAVDFNVHNSVFSRPPGEIGKRAMNRSFNFMWEGHGTLGSAHPIGDILQCCGMTETVTAGTSVVYTPAAITALKTATIVADHGGGVLWKSVYTYGNVVMTANVNDGLRCAFTGRGRWAAPTAGTTSTWSPGTMRAKAAINIGGSVVTSKGSYSAIIDNISFNRGAAIVDIEDMNAATGLHGLLFADAVPSLQLAIAVDQDESANMVYTGTNAGTSLYQLIADGQTVEVGFTIGTGQTGNSTHFYFPSCQIRAAKESDKNGYRIVTLDMRVADAAANNGEFTITITSA